jgi:Zn-finger nucleic acid-binding protein
VWLDRGELDKIIDRSAGSTQSPPQQVPQATYPPQQPNYGHQPHPSHGHHTHYRKKKREGFLGELFDFD